MTIINFAKEAEKRGVPLLPVLTDEIDTEEYLIYQGNYKHKEDRVQITVDTTTDRILLELFDIKLNEKYAEFEFDSYTLFLISETARIAFKEIDKEH